MCVCVYTPMCMCVEVRGQWWVHSGLSQTQIPHWVPGLLNRDGKEISELRFRISLLQRQCKSSWVSQIPSCVKFQTPTCTIRFSGDSCQSRFFPLSESRTMSSHDWNHSIGNDHFQRFAGRTDLTCASESINHLVMSPGLFATPWTIAPQAPLSVGFSRQEYWSRFPFPSPVDLPDPGIKHGSRTLQADSLPSEPPGMPWSYM